MPDAVVIGAGHNGLVAAAKLADAGWGVAVLEAQDVSTDVEETAASLDASNLRGGAVGAGTQQLHQQLVFRPTPGLGRPSTPVAGLYLAGASAHPGAGVHGACGANAAGAALTSERLGQTGLRRRRTSNRPPSDRSS